MTCLGLASSIVCVQNLGYYFETKTDQPSMAHKRFNVANAFPFQLCECISAKSTEHSLRTQPIIWVLCTALMCQAVLATSICTILNTRGTLCDSVWIRNPPPPLHLQCSEQLQIIAGLEACQSLARRRYGNINIRKHQICPLALWTRARQEILTSEVMVGCSAHTEYSVIPFLVIFFFQGQKHRICS